MPRPWVLIDLSYLRHRAFHSVRGLDMHGEQTGVMYGLLEHLRHICSLPRIKSNRVVVCADSRKSYRKIQFPQYKARRKKEYTPEEMEAARQFYAQVRRLRDVILPEMGIQVLRQTGLESDDVMAAAVRWVVARPLETAVMVTADHDLYQCISPAVSWYDPTRDVWMEVADLWVKLGVYPEQWAEVKAIAGCSSDGVPGVRGVGEKTAIQFLSNELPWKSKRSKAIRSDEGQVVVQRNRLLVTLPHARTQPVELVEPNYDSAAFYVHCERWGFSTMLGPRRGLWDAFFCGDSSCRQPVPRMRRSAGV